jgi:putative transposase
LGPLNNVITIDDERIKNHHDRLVQGSVEETLNAPLGAEAGPAMQCAEGWARLERSEAVRDTRAGYYERQLQTKSGVAEASKLRAQTTAIM